MRPRTVVWPDGPGVRGPAARLGGGAPGSVAWPPPMSTRRLIVAALLCGLAILVAFSVQLVLAR